MEQKREDRIMVLGAIILAMLAIIWLSWLGKRDVQLLEKAQMVEKYRQELMVENGQFVDPQSAWHNFTKE